MVEVLNELKRIERGLPSGSYRRICTVSGKCYSIYVQAVELQWESGLLREVRIVGRFVNGNGSVVLRKTLSWSPEGYLQSVSGWEEA